MAMRDGPLQLSEEINDDQYDFKSDEIEEGN